MVLDDLEERGGDKFANLVLLQVHQVIVKLQRIGLMLSIKS
jgi:hypothetical protein